MASYRRAIKRQGVESGPGPKLHDAVASAASAATTAAAPPPPPDFLTDRIDVLRMKLSAKIRLLHLYSAPRVSGALTKTKPSFTLLRIPAKHLRTIGARDFPNAIIIAIRGSSQRLSPLAHKCVAKAPHDAGYSKASVEAVEIGWILGREAGARHTRGSDFRIGRIK